MTQTASSAIAGLVTFEVQAGVLENLRRNLVYANRAWSEQGKLMKGMDTARFVFIPDLAVSTTPMTEGTTPTAVALSETHVDVSTSQYGNLVDITDIAEAKSPVDLVAEASEHLSRNVQEVIDTVSRDAIAAGGTAFYAGGKTSRAGLTSSEVLKGSDLRKMYFTMRKAKVPTLPDGNYYLILGTEQAYDLKTDTTTASGVIPVLQYTRPDVVISGEIQAYEGFRFLIAQAPPTFSGNGITVTGAIAFGPLKGWGVADLQTLSVHHVAPGGDHSDPLALSRKLGWKMNFGVATLANSRYYRLESATTTL